MEGEGFEPSKAEPTDLQSAPFDRSGTPPNEGEHYQVFRNQITLFTPEKINQKILDGIGIMVQMKKV